jgi:hypothetical protein
MSRKSNTTREERATGQMFDRSPVVDPFLDPAHVRSVIEALWAAEFRTGGTVSRYLENSPHLREDVKA